MLPKSSVSHIDWPALPDRQGALLLSVQQQLAESQWLDPAELERLQMGALKRLLTHAVATAPHYRDSGAYAELVGLPELTPSRWRELPVLTRSALQEAGPAVRSESVPEDHKPLTEMITTGSTGRPVRAVTTGVTAVFWLALTLRDLLWHERDVSAVLAAIRADHDKVIPPEGLSGQGWGPATAPYPSGPSRVLGITETVETQARWLVAQDPEYLLSYPSNLLALGHHLKDDGVKLPRLRELMTYGEALGPHGRADLEEAWGVPLVDMYSSQELGYLALQCPQSDEYHVQAESVYLEVLDDDDRPCPPGAVGRVVVTPLHNYAMPMLRYELGDYAQVGSPCLCGRGLPVLSRIAGRQRNMWLLPGGQRVWPMFGSTVWGHIRDIRQLQMVQHSLDHIEARIVGPGPLTADDEREFTRLAREAFPFHTRLTFDYRSQIDRGEGMKFEDFVSLIPGAQGGPPQGSEQL